MLVGKVVYVFKWCEFKSTGKIKTAPLENKNYCILKITWVFSVKMLHKVIQAPSNFGCHPNQYHLKSLSHLMAHYAGYI